MYLHLGFVVITKTVDTNFSFILLQEEEMRNVQILVANDWTLSIFFNTLVLEMFDFSILDLFYTKEIHLLQWRNNGYNPIAIFTWASVLFTASSYRIAVMSRTHYAVPNRLRESSNTKWFWFALCSTSQTPLTGSCQSFLWNIWNLLT